MASSTPKTDIRVRFAPSPTGFLHIGNLRAGLFNWLYARHHGGKFLLRIEDTDLERSEERFTQDIMSSLKWLGIDWEEDVIYQSKRMPVYQEKADRMIAEGHAYRCYCSEAEVEQMREKAMKEGKKPMYDRRCRDRKDQPAGQPFVIRAKVPLDGSVEFKDLLRGSIKVENTEVDDFVLIRSNGAPTYNLSCVIDDVETRITHVIRGDDHINNTPKQIHLYRFLSSPQPEFAHLPMILGADKKKLSKRHGATSVNAYREEGYLPEALLNFLVRLGWSHGDQEIFSTEEMIRLFDFDHVQNASGVFNPEKLVWLNGHYMRLAAPERLAGILAENHKDLFPGELLARATSPIGVKLVALIQQKVKLVKEIAEQLLPLCAPGAVEIDASQVKWGKDPAQKPVIQAAVREVRDILSKKIAEAPARVQRKGGDEAWGAAPALSDAGIGHNEIDAILKQVAEHRGIKLGELAGPMRWSVSGRPASAGLFDLLPLLPWDIIEPRLEKVDTL